MTEGKIIAENPLTMGEVKEKIDEIKKRDKELNFRANKTEEYINQVTTVKNSKELIKKIEELQIPRLKDHHIKKIIDILPKTEEGVKIVLQGYTLTVNTKNIKRIVDVIKKFLENKQ